MPIPADEFDQGILYLAVKYGDFIEVKRLLDQSSFLQLAEMIKYNDYAAFRGTQEPYRPDIMKAIIQAVSQMWQKQMIIYQSFEFILSVSPYLSSHLSLQFVLARAAGHFRNALDHGDIDTAIFLLKSADVKNRESMLKGLYEAVYDADGGGGWFHLRDNITAEGKSTLEIIPSVLKYLDAKLRPRVFLFNEDDFCSYINRTGNVDFLKTFLSGHDSKINFAIFKSVFCHAVKDANVDIMEKVISLVSDKDKTNLIETSYYDSLRLAAQSGNLSFFKYVLNRSDKAKNLCIILNSLPIFEAAIKGGHCHILNFLFESVGVEKETFLLQNITIFYRACGWGQKDAILYLLSLLGEERKKEIIISDNYLVLRTSVLADNLESFLLLFKLTKLSMLQALALFQDELTVKPTILHYLIKQAMSENMPHFTQWLDEYGPLPLFVRNGLGFFSLPANHPYHDYLKNWVEAFLLKNYGKLLVEGVLLNNLSLIRHLLTWMNDDQLKQLFLKNNWVVTPLYVDAFIKAAENGSIEMMSMLLGRVSLEQRILIVNSISPKAVLGMIYTANVNNDVSLLSFLKENLYKYLLNIRDEYVLKSFFVQGEQPEKFLDSLLSFYPDYAKQMSVYAKKEIELYRKRAFEINSVLLSVGLPSEIANKIISIVHPVFGFVKKKDSLGRPKTLMDRYSDLWYQKEARVRTVNPPQTFHPPTF